MILLPSFSMTSKASAFSPPIRICAAMVGPSSRMSIGRVGRNSGAYSTRERPSETRYQSEGLVRSIRVNPAIFSTCTALPEGRTPCWIIWEVTSLRRTPGSSVIRAKAMTAPMKAVNRTMPSSDRRIVRARDSEVMAGPCRQAAPRALPVAAEPVGFGAGLRQRCESSRNLDAGMACGTGHSSPPVSAWTVSPLPFNSLPELPA